MKPFPVFTRISAMSLVAMACGAQAQPIPPIVDKPYPGTLLLQVDATDVARKIFRVKETLPVSVGPLTLFYPRWIPGDHGPTGPINQLAGLKFAAAGKPVAWRRDTLDTNAFHVEVPAGASPLEIEFQFVSPVSTKSGRVTMTPEMLGLQWNTVLLYPAGHPVNRIAVKASLRLPEGWGSGTSLERASQTGAVTEFKTVSAETLVDSPVFAAQHFQRVDLDPDGVSAGRVPVFLNVMADSAAELVMTPEQVAAHRALVAQAYRLYGARHYAHYDFLLAISDEFSGIGLEHHQSSENGLGLGYFSEWAKTSEERDLLAHEYTHSWNGKFRRPADLLTASYNTPMQDSLLWVYEGQTQFWGEVLATRSGLVSPADERDAMALSAAWLTAQPGRSWRNLQDTTNEPIVSVHGGPDWHSWQRGWDYYAEMVFVWLEADMLIRDQSHGARSLDDFARAFFGTEPGRITPLTYTFDDVVRELNRVQKYDWSGFLRERLDRHDGGALLAGLQAAGWRLAWSEQPSEYFKASEAKYKHDDFVDSIGFIVGKEAKLSTVRWGSPAFDAGMTTALTLVAVNGHSYKAEGLKAAITEAKGGAAPIELLVKEGETYRTVALAYSGGLRYPKLERIEGTEDRLARVLAPRP